jgi:hypothetical protein
MPPKKQPKTQGEAPAALSTEGAGRKPWVKKTPAEVVLEQIGKQEQKVQDMEAESDARKA